MSLSAFLPLLVRSLIPLAAGYALGRWKNVSAEPLGALLRFLLFPALLLDALLGPLSQPILVRVVVTGIAMALAGFWLVRLLGRFAGVALSRATAMPNIACVALPLLALTLGARSSTLMAAAALFVAVALTLTVSELGERSFAVLRREPWVYAAGAALVLQLADIEPQGLQRAISPVVEASWAIALAYLGLKLHPLKGGRDKTVWLSAAGRLLTGLGVALLALWLVPLPQTASLAVIAVGLAPAATTSMALMRAPTEREEGHATAAWSTLISLLALLLWRVFLAKS